MKKASLLLLLFACFNSYAQKYVEVSDIQVPTSIVMDNHTLVLNGAEVREKYWIDLYVGSLFLTNKTQHAQEIINSKEPMNIRMQMVSSLIDSEAMIDAINEGFERSTKGNPKSIEKEIQQLIDIFSEPIKDGDVYDLFYNPAVGVKVYKNGKHYGNIPGYDFKTALFGIWLGPNPASSDLKEGMLGLK